MRIALRLAPAAAMATFLCSVVAQAQQIGSPERGLAYAERNCAECHGVRRTEEVSPRRDATPFQVVARQPGINERALSVFLSTPHKTMPNIVVTGQDRDDLIAHILSLRGAP